MAFFRRPAEDEPGPVAPPTAEGGSPGSTPGSTLVGERTNLDGKIATGEDLFIRGQFDGTIEAESAVVVHRGGRVKASLAAGEVAIHGRVEGDISAGGLVEISETGSLTGNIRAPQVKVSAGASFRGQISRGKGGTGARANLKSAPTSGAKPGAKKAATGKTAPGAPEARPAAGRSGGANGGR